MREDLTDRLLPESIGPSVHLEKAALRETQIVLGERTSSAALALVATALVFACLPEEAALVVSLLRKGGVWLAAALCVLSLAFWYRFYRACRRLNALGLYRRPRGIRASWNWEIAGSFVSLGIAATVCGVLGWELRNFGAGLLPGLLVAVWLGRRLRHIPDYETARAEQNAKLSIRQTEDE